MSQHHRSPEWHRVRRVVRTVIQAACCLSCRRFTFWHEGGCHWESCELYQPGHEVDHFAREIVPCPIPGCPEANYRRVHRLGMW